jgi:hypothetical protein
VSKAVHRGLSKYFWYAPLLYVDHGWNPRSTYNWYAKSIFALQSSRSLKFNPGRFKCTVLIWK